MSESKSVCKCVVCVPSHSRFMMTGQTDNFSIFGSCYDLADPPQFHAHDTTYTTGTSFRFMRNREK